MNLIGLSGLAGAGKSEAALALAEHMGFVEVGFADEIKRTAARWYGFTERQLFGPSETRNETDEHGLSAREACQKIGTEVARGIRASTWIDLALRNASEVLAAAEDGDRVSYVREAGIVDWPAPCAARGVVIPDCRYKNEIDAIHAAGGKVIRIVRNGAGLNGGAAQHASEVEQQSIPDEAFDAVLVNDGAIEDLQHAVCTQVAMMLGLTYPATTTKGAA